MIDTHQHLIYPDRFNYPWTSDLPSLQGKFGIAEYREASEGTGITGTIFMEVDVDSRQSIDEAKFFCELAENPANEILGIIASARPEEKGFANTLDAMNHPKLVGVRRVLHVQPDELSQTNLFRENIRFMGRRGLPFDLCVLQRQLNLALDLVRACPETLFVLDHCGVPDIAGNDALQGAGWNQWKSAIKNLAALPNTRCKISGISVYASADQRNVENLRPYVAEVISAFGPGRCVWGGDWPVVKLGAGLHDWCRISKEIIESEAGADAGAIFTTNAIGIYKLETKG